MSLALDTQPKTKAKDLSAPAALKLPKPAETEAPLNLREMAKQAGNELGNVTADLLKALLPVSAGVAQMQGQQAASFGGLALPSRPKEKKEPATTIVTAGVGAGMAGRNTTEIRIPKKTSSS